MTRALIIANGTLPSSPIVKRFQRLEDVIICADGGANHARRLGIRPDTILGDLDSITPSTRKYFKWIPVMFIQDQESSDLEKAISFCILRQYTHVDILGGTGDRIDHSTGSLGCFRKFGEQIEIRLIDTVGILRQVQGSLKLTMKKGDLVSLIPLNRCGGVTTSHLKYPLKNKVLELGKREGTSNEATGRDLRVSVKKGTLLCYTFHPR